ncbi:glycosyltransferase [Flavisolibacter ginsenosidimutans]|uniref:Glycosyltransferase family 1 protein n=1 Tax=Flavisolibacter ginsenosidimutans TaxID=661481 RepID=A0A5B8UMT9_9BACT|nr:hypothetical protein [Flavisolibacter ginsenosidimutans]QEC57692.1 hypothetical protein FSB75_17875 [Flavisolibacter ginsenosidimutans]
MNKLRIVVTGFIGLYPTGGVTWDYIQYPLGLKLLGHDVYYIEDTLQFPKYQKEGRQWNDATDSIEYLATVMNDFGLNDRWAYRDVATGNCYGLSINKVLEICRTADVFINVSASAFLREEYLSIPKRVLIDSDPMFTQIEYLQQKELNAGKSPYKMDFLVENHNYLFTFGENLGQVDCRVPSCGFHWHVTRQPVCLDHWQPAPLVESKSFTTVMNWSVSPDLVFGGTTWGQKNSEFERILGIPSRFPGLSFALMVSNMPLGKKDEVRNAGWHILDPLSAITTSADYKAFLASSAAEFSVAKQTYVKGNTGWFSCRSACYLALGKPVVTQETGWSKYLPSGEGLFAFYNFDSAAAAVAQVKERPAFHAKKARALAKEFFDSNKILSKLLEEINRSQTQKSTGDAFGLKAFDPQYT